MNGRRRAVPLGVLVLVAAVPAASFASVWRLAEGHRDLDAAVEADVDTLGATPSPTQPLVTALLSYRRQPALVAQRVAEVRTEADLARRIDGLRASVDEAVGGSGLATACLRVEIDGVVTVDLGGGSSPVPASTLKLITAAVALDTLGPDFRFRTEVRSTPPVGGVVSGDVVLVGGGDPVLQTDAFADPQRYPAFNTTSLDELADRLVGAGVTSIDGAVVGDGSRYDDEFRAPSWGSDITNFDAGPYDALLVDDGFLDDGNHGLVPARSAAAKFVDLLRERGVVVRDGAANADRDPSPSEATLAFVESDPLTEVLVEMLHTSDNNTAELVLKEIGFGAVGAGTRAAGLDVVRERLAEWSESAVDLADGSGLSRANAVGCDVLTAVLGSTPVSDELLDLLPAAGRDGTLATRFLGTPAEGVLRAKTGTLTDVKALAGEMPDGDGRSAVFALVLNGDGVDRPEVHEPVWRALVDFIDGLPVVVPVDVDEFRPWADASTGPASEAVS